MASVLILGAASDMAVAIARKFASDKYDVIVAGRDLEFLNTLQSDLSIRYNVKSAAIKFDALDYRSHESFYQNLPFKPDVTICVFGYLGDQEKAMKKWDETSKIIATNYTGAVSVLNIVANDYEEKKKGIIVGISSVAGERGRQSNFIYGSAKAAFTAYLSGLRNSLYKSGVHVVTVLPGFVYTKMTAELPLPKMLTATPEEVANVVKKAVVHKKNRVYVKWFWKWIMLIIKLIPEPVFKKMKL
jgi:decaprenylphospho-beta-D-erythro-pentofuranosid-2-ulose 2-reductase